MQYADALGEINWLAVVVATLLAFVVGGVWYSKGFLGKKWQNLVGLKDSDLKNANMAHSMGGTLVLTFVANTFLALIMYGVGPSLLTLADGAVFGALVGAFMVATALGVNYLYEQKSLELWAINSGYIALNFVVAGAVIGAWV